MSSPTGSFVAALASMGFAGGITGRSMPSVNQPGHAVITVVGRSSWQGAPMATIHTGTTMVPSKLELLADWLPRQPWYRSTGRPPQLARAGGFRLHDPDGEVGIEFAFVSDGGDPIYQVPMTYRSAPLPGAED